MTHRISDEMVLADDSGFPATSTGALTH